MYRPHPLESVRKLREKTDTVVVAFSRGKDALAAMALVRKHFPVVHAFYCYLVPDLGFEERSLSYYEKRFNIPHIHRLPHWYMANVISQGVYRVPWAGDKPLRRMKELDIFDEARRITGCDWIVTGRRADDSLWRRSTVAGQPDGIFEKRREAWPLAWWSTATVWNFLKSQNLALPGDYRFGKSSSGSIDLKSLLGIRKLYPDDFKKIVSFYPYVEAEIARSEFRKEWSKGESVPEVRDAADSPAATEERGVQSAND